MKRSLLLAVAFIGLVPSLSMADDSKISIEGGAVVTSQAGLGPSFERINEGSRDSNLPSLTSDFKVAGNPNGIIGTFRVGGRVHDYTVEGTLAPDFTPVSWTYGIRAGKYLVDNPSSSVRVFIDAGFTGAVDKGVVEQGRGEVALGVMSRQQLSSLIDAEAAAKTDITGKHLIASADLKFKLGENSRWYVKAGVARESLKPRVLQDGSNHEVKNTTVAVTAGAAF